MAPEGLATPQTGVGLMYLAKLVKAVPHINRPQDGPDVQLRCASVEEFREAHAGDEYVQATMRNKVKVCGKCGKPNAFTMLDCNSCGSSLSAVPLSYTDNVFMGFIYGIGKGRFPFTISIRKEEEEYLSFDDPLSLGPVHLNAIPTGVYIPDFRYLFLDPARGLEVLNNMFRVGAQAAMQSYWSDVEFRRAWFNGEEPPASYEGLAEIALCGCNFPPSQFQLHLQFIHPPLLPFHFLKTKDNTHFTQGRFFPLEFIRKALALGPQAKMDVDEDTPVERIVQRMKELGVNYDAIYFGFMRRCWQMQERFSPWREEDFARRVINGRVFSRETGAPAPGEDPQVIQKEDTVWVQNYGRPYQANSKPSGSFYKFSKAPGDVRKWP